MYVLIVSVGGIIFFEVDQFNFFPQLGKARSFAVRLAGRGGVSFFPVVEIKLWDYGVFIVIAILWSRQCLLLVGVRLIYNDLYMINMILVAYNSLFD
jgi:hypothetical protein